MKSQVGLEHGKFTYKFPPANTASDLNLKKEDGKSLHAASEESGMKHKPVSQKIFTKLFPYFNSHYVQVGWLYKFI